ncbi:MAG: hypothetical protein WCL50_04560 [Spirochaetota bacterium]
MLPRHPAIGRSALPLLLPLCLGLGLGLCPGGSLAAEEAPRYTLSADAATSLTAGAAAGDFALRIVRRGLTPSGGGEIVLDAPRVAAVPPVDMTDEGAVRKLPGE